MIEQKIEKIVIERAMQALSADGFHDGDIQPIGAWQTASQTIKAIEDSSAIGILAVKVYPRQYETPTIPDGSFQVELNLTMRADIDEGGVEWLIAAESISRLLQGWQRRYDGYNSTFAIEGEFTPTGFQLTGGDCGLNTQNTTWQYLQSFTLYGIIDELPTQT